MVNDPARRARGRAQGGLVMALPLDGLVVFDAAVTVAGQFLGRLLAEQGADVHAEKAPAVGFARDFLFRGKREGWPVGTQPAVVVVDRNPAAAPAELQPQAVRARWPGATYVAITPHGITGRWADVPGDDLTADALSGVMSLRGDADGGPNAAPPHVIQEAAAYAAYVALLQQLLLRPGAPAVIDVSLAETAMLFGELHGSYGEYVGLVPNRRLMEIVSLFGFMRTADGWIMAHNWGEPGWVAANALLGGEGLTDDVANGRLTDLAHHDREIRASVAPWFAARKKWELTEEAQALRLHWGASATIAELVDDPHVRATDALEEVAPGVRVPRLPLRPIGFEVEAAPLPVRPLRVLDLTHYWAGPSCTRMLADFGMEVIKLELPQKPDPVRLQIPKDNQVQPFPLERGWWNGLNVAKRSLGLDIRTPRGRELLLSLAAGCDVLIENFSATAMEHFGLGREVIHGVNPDIVFVSMSAFGTRGPYRSYIAFGSNLEPLAGIPELVGDPDGPPQEVASAIPDTFGAFLGAAAVLTGLMARRKGGRGMWIDISQHQSLLCLIAWAFHELGATGTAPGRQPVHADGHAYRGILRCAGDDDWVAVSIAERGTVDAAQRHIGAPPDAEPGVAFAAWAASRNAGAAAAELRDLGVAAMPVLDVISAWSHDLAIERGTFRELETAAGFPMRGLGSPFTVDGVRPRGAPRTPRFGSSTRDILQQLAGLSAGEIDDLIAAGVAADTVVADWAPTPLPIDDWLALGAARKV